MQTFLEELTLLSNAPRAQRTEAEESLVYQDAFKKWRALSSDEQRDILFIRDLDVHVKNTVIREQECTRIDAKTATIIRLADYKTNLFKWLVTSVRNPRMSYHYTNTYGNRLEETIQRKHVDPPKPSDRKRTGPTKQLMSKFQSNNVGSNNVGSVNSDDALDSSGDDSSDSSDDDLSDLGDEDSRPIDVDALPVARHCKRLKSQVTDESH